MKHLSLRRAALAASLAAAGAAAQAAPFVVDAFANSSGGGVGAATIALTMGQSFSVNVDPGDLWNAGALPRWSNADGLTGNLLATGSDDSLQPAGTLIGADFGILNQSGLAAPFGTLVGQIGAGSFFAIGTSFNGVASATGTLNLYYWDSNFGDNTEFITADVRVNAIPEPQTYALMLAGLGLLSFIARRRRR